MSNEQDYRKKMEKHHHTQQLRKTKRKMRPNTASRKPRQRDWEHMTDDEWDAPGFYEDERVMPLGTTGNRKVVEGMARAAVGEKKGEEAPELTDIPDDQAKGQVVEVTAGQCVVSVDGRLQDCVVRGNLLSKETIYSNLVTVGDWVLVEEAEGELWAVVEVLPRSSKLARPQKRKGGSYHQLVAANIDRLLVVVSWRKPNIWPELIDRYLIAAQRNQLQAVICVNKIDLVEEHDELETTLEPYRQAGYEVFMTSAASGAGIPHLHELLVGQTTVLAGMSGVGKSSLLSAVQPGLSLRALTVGERGMNRGQGRHTTTMATMYPLAEGGAVIDTPGIRQFGLAFLELRELGTYYPEFVPLIGQCAFSDCTHAHEPDCAVQKGVETGIISQMRYENYLKILETL